MAEWISTGAGDAWNWGAAPRGQWDLGARMPVAETLLMCSLPVVGERESWLLAPKDLTVQLARGPRPSEMRASV